MKKLNPTPALDCLRLRQAWDNRVECYLTSKDLFTLHVVKIRPQDVLLMSLVRTRPTERQRERDAGNGGGGGGAERQRRDTHRDRETETDRQR